MSRQTKKPLKLDLKTLLTLAVLLVALLAGCQNGWLDTAGKDSGAIIAPQAIADYIFEHGELPDNFITKKEAEALGWDSSRNYVSDVAPGKSIGGDRFGNYEGLLPDKNGRKWTEADANYVSGPRGAERIVFSNDRLVYYTDDHYESFTKMSPSK
ncbi:MAG: ribonuclease [Clostridia bacterium]|nr:ribonuclease [Clostridia bacterium]